MIRADAWPLAAGRDTLSPHKAGERHGSTRRNECRNKSGAALS